MGKGGGAHTAITTDHVSRGEFLNDVQAVFAFGTHERDIKVKPKRFILRQRETHHREVQLLTYDLLLRMLLR